MKKSQICIKIALILPILTSCSKEMEVVSQTTYNLSTFCSVTLYDYDIDYIYEINSLLSYYDNLFDGYYRSSTDDYNLYNLNRASEPLVVADDLYEIIKIGYSFTNEYFNILSFNLNELFKDAYLGNALPTSSEIEQALEDIRNTTIVFDDEAKSIYIDGNAKIDLGAIAKGYVLNKVYEYLQENNIKHYLIDLGSSSIGLSTKSDGSSFIVSLKDAGVRFTMSNCFLSTSSIYEQGIELDGVRYSHIVNPTTGEAITNYELVCIKNDDPLVGDILATMITLIDDEEIIYDLIDEYDLELLVITSDEELVYFTDGWRLYNY